MPEDGRIQPMPAGLSFEEAAAISFGGTTALHFLREQKYDIIFDTFGSTGFSAGKPALSSEGRLLMAAASLPQILGSAWGSMTSKQKALAGSARVRVEDLRYLKEVVEAGRFKPLIDRCFPLEQIADAHAHVDSGRKRGSVVITMDSGSSS